jgi:hypothetical protein
LFYQLIEGSRTKEIAVRHLSRKNLKNKDTADNKDQRNMSAAKGDEAGRKGRDQGSQIH